MSVIKQKLSGTLHLRLALNGQFDATAVVVKCILRDNVDAQIGSTITLAHVAEGVFKDSSQTMPNTPVLTARFRVYEVDGTTPHVNHKAAADVYLLDTQTSDIADQVWDELGSGHILDGSFGQIVQDLYTGDSVEVFILDDDQVSLTVED